MFDSPVAVETCRPPGESATPSEIMVVTVVMPSASVIPAPESNCDVIPVVRWPGRPGGAHVTSGQKSGHKQAERCLRSPIEF